MVSVRNTVARKKRTDDKATSNGGTTHRHDAKYRKKKSKKQGHDNKNPRLFIVGIVLILIWIWAQRHFNWKQQQSKLARLKRAYSLQKFRQEKETAADSHQGHVDEGSIPKKKKKKPLRDTEEKKEPQHDVEKDEKEAQREPVQRHEGEYSESDLDEAITVLDHDMLDNRHGGIRFIDPKLLPSIPDGSWINPLMQPLHKDRQRGAIMGGVRNIEEKSRFRASRRQKKFAWEKEELPQDVGPKFDYTLEKHYEYPTRLTELPKEGGYPHLETLGTLMDRWPQDAIDDPPNPIKEELQRFDYSNPQELAMAKRFRDAELPFKVYNVPELSKANLKWTDEYLSHQFDDTRPLMGRGRAIQGEGGLGAMVKNFLRGGGTAGEQEEGDFANLPEPPMSRGTCQESHNNFFSFFVPGNWDVRTMGLPPTRNNDFSFKRWASHARYADAVGLSFDQPHFYFQSGIPREERLGDKADWTFVSRDLPSWSSPTSTFFVFEVENQKGIQCRFGERGVTAATHYDAGRNMVAMITGAKRYVLSPPNQCSKLGIINVRGQPAFRHSLLNFAHLAHLNSTDKNGMSEEERKWLERAQTSLAVETVLKAGEVLYIPSHWFHYITSLQKSAQCNVRSGRESKGTPEFGGFDDVDKCE